MTIVNHGAHGLKAYYHDCVMSEEDRIDKHGEPVNYGYAKLKADRVIYAGKHKRALLYAKNHELEAQTAQDAIRLVRLNSEAFTEQRCADFVTYWTRVRNNHAKHHAEWLAYAAYFKTKAEER